MKIHICPYRDTWPHMFYEESQHIAAVLKHNCKAIYHIGSTSIPTLSAKPIIDMAAAVSSILAIDYYTKPIAKLGYEAKGEYGIPFRRYFTKREQACAYNLHIFEHGNLEVEKFLLFRDYLIASPLDRKAYVVLKKKLAETYTDDMAAYSIGKNEFIQHSLKKAGFKGA